MITEEQLDNLYNNLIAFANSKSNSKLRIGIEYMDSNILIHLAHFNISHVSLSLFNHVNPDISTLQRLQIRPNGLSFNAISFRVEDGGPGVATIKFEEDKFVLQIYEESKKYESDISFLCDEFNQAIGYLSPNPH
ncbi:hypothetical protein BN59_01107 [Legionella massiliensis]|uniref:Uncharacterized protein n=1 Tax=Legionella massiliensis TaxID=1034943 RepID=A0A078KUW3_9GAMM|nr:hypothetical protein [Legionella massiliensis]CDZ76831.1 hypothetical protein BN59_01107 [Legionella massiliensis]CEE12569.1 hypothetical protein BN1094_01107 [Legionella massiliensis]